MLRQEGTATGTVRDVLVFPVDFAEDLLVADRFPVAAAFPDLDLADQVRSMAADRFLHTARSPAAVVLDAGSVAEADSGFINGE